MKVIIQRVSKASVTIESEIYSEIGPGLLVFLGIEADDSLNDADWLVTKISQMRIFSDEQGKMNLSLIDQGGQLLIISQFTLIADTKKGNRPSFIRAARPAEAVPLYEAFIVKFRQLLEKDQVSGILSTNFLTKVFTGVFGADMQVSLINDGPVTIEIDTRNKN